MTSRRTTARYVLRLGAARKEGAALVEVTIGDEATVRIPLASDDKPIAKSEQTVPSGTLCLALARRTCIGKSPSTARPSVRSRRQGAADANHSRIRHAGIRC